jgi:PAS domain S-box-containing protein
MNPWGITWLARQPSVACALAIAVLLLELATTLWNLDSISRTWLKLTTLMLAIASAVTVVVLFNIHRQGERNCERLRRNAAWFRSTLRSIGDAVVATDVDGRVTFLNPIAETLTGWKYAEAEGKPVAHICRIGSQMSGETVGNPIARVLRDGCTTGLPDGTSLTSKDGSSRPIHNLATPILDDAGNIQGVVLIFHDAARDVGNNERGAAGSGPDSSEGARVEAERELLLAAAEAARADAESANQMKDEFLAILSHELRTPLNAIVGWAKILRSGKVDADDLEEGLAAIDRNAHAQTQIVEDLLDISRIASGNLRLDVQRLNVGEVIEAAIAAVLPSAHAKEIHFHKLLDSLAGPVTGDAARLQQIVWNLLVNAVKFTPRGGQVQVLLERANSHIEISVIDTGIGIKPEFLPHVFDRFRQADASTTRRHAGLGLGLAIAKQLVEMHGGSIRAKSAGEGQGATFTIMLPIIVVDSRRPEPHPVRPGENDFADDACPDGALAGLKVLVVDDEADARELLRHVLVESRAEVALASSAAEALVVIKQFRPDVIVSDIGMPEQDGYDLIRQLRADPATYDIPAAALTAFARPNDRKRSLLAGFQTHVAKPVDPAELRAVVASLAFRTGWSDLFQGRHHAIQPAPDPDRG